MKKTHNTNLPQKTPAGHFARQHKEVLLLTFLMRLNLRVKNMLTIATWFPPSGVHKLNTTEMSALSLLEGT